MSKIKFIDALNARLIAVDLPTVTEDEVYRKLFKQNKASLYSESEKSKEYKLNCDIKNSVHMLMEGLTHIE